MAERPSAVWEDTHSNLTMVVFITTATVTSSLGHGLRTLTAVPRSTQLSTLCGTVKWVSAYGLSNDKMAMVDVDNISLPPDSRSKLVGLVWSLATWRSVCIHQVNPCNGSEPGWQHHKHCRWYQSLLHYSTNAGCNARCCLNSSSYFCDDVYGCLYRFVLQLVTPTASVVTAPVKANVTPTNATRASPTPRKARPASVTNEVTSKKSILLRSEM